MALATPGYREVAAMSAEPVSKADVRVILMGGSVANRLALRHHYLQRKRAGRCVCYAVLWKGMFEGILIFAFPPVSHPMFGYKPGEVVELARVWFEHNPKNLGSCAIRKALAQLVEDWPDAQAVVSWCDLSRFDGALYKATVFEYMGKSRVRALEASAAKYTGGRTGRQVQPDRCTQKDIYLIRLKTRDMPVEDEISKVREAAKPGAKGDQGTNDLQDVRSNSKTYGIYDKPRAGTALQGTRARVHPQDRREAGKAAKGH